jgi:hypothetical protein
MAKWQRIAGLLACLFSLEPGAQTLGTPKFSTISTPTTNNVRCTGVASTDTALLQAAVAAEAVSTTSYVIKVSGLCLTNAQITLTAANSGLTIIGEDRQNATIRMAPGANYNYIFYDGQGAGNTLTNLTVRDITIDGNYSNQTGVPSSSIFAFGGGGSYTFHMFDNVNLINCGKACVQYQTTGAVTNIDIRDSILNTSACSQLLIYDATFVFIKHNYFSNYNQSLQSSFCAAIVGAESTSTANANWNVIDNEAYPNGSIEFWFEMDTAVGVNPWAIKIEHNNCNAQGGNGCGVSMYGDHSDVSYNSIINATYGDRSGCECAGNDFQIIGNNYYNGQISVANNTNNNPTAYFNATTSSTNLTVNSVSSGALAIGQFVFGPGVPVNTYIVSGSGTAWVLNNSIGVTAQNLTAGGAYGIIVKDNIIGLHGAPTANGVSAIQVAVANHVEIRDNLITINFTNTTNSYPAIYVGFYGGAAPTNYVIVEGNRVTDLSPSSSMIGIKVNDSATTPDNYVFVRRNTVEGFQTGLFFDSDSYSTYIIACSNDFRSVGTAISGTPAGTGSSVSNAVCTTSF